MELIKDEYRKMEVEWKKIFETLEVEKNVLIVILEVEKKMRQILEA